MEVISFKGSTMALVILMLVSYCCNGEPEPDPAYKSWKDPKEQEPYFDAYNPRSVLVQEKHNTSLPCRVHDRRNESVAWIRQRDQHIMAVDNSTFISDSRFEPEYDASSKTWYLNIYHARVADAGVYECQLSTNPKKSLPIKLHVSVPKVDILGDAEMIVKKNSRVDIKCRIRGTLDKPEKVNWYQNGKRVLGIIYTSELEEGDYVDPVAAPRGPSSGAISGRKNVDNKSTDHDDEEEDDEDEESDEELDETLSLTPTFVSSLIITSTTPADAGNYTCQPDDLPVATVSLFVIRGEQPAAIQRSSSPSSTAPFTNAVGMFIFMLAITVLTSSLFNSQVLTDMHPPGPSLRHKQHSTPSAARDAPEIIPKDDVSPRDTVAPENVEEGVPISASTSIEKRVMHERTRMVEDEHQATSDSVSHGDNLCTIRAEFHQQNSSAECSSISTLQAPTISKPVMAPERPPFSRRKYPIIIPDTHLETIVKKSPRLNENKTSCHDIDSIDAVQGCQGDSPCMGMFFSRHYRKEKLSTTKIPSTILNSNLSLSEKHCRKTRGNRSLVNVGSENVNWCRLLFVDENEVDVYTLVHDTIHYCYSTLLVALTRCDHRSSERHIFGAIIYLHEGAIKSVIEFLPSACMKPFFHFCCSYKMISLSRHF